MTIKSPLKWLIPPAQWKVPVIIVVGILTGLAAFVFKISNAPSYLSDRPETCINCHIMGPQYATWSHSSHRAWTNCNDCHVPHNNLLNHYYFKAKDGTRHATIFTLRNEPQVIFIKQAGKDAVQKNCERCHTHLISNDKLQTMRPEFHPNIKDRYCVDCHREIPHGRVNSLSSVPYARLPLPQSPVPAWLKRNLKESPTP